MIINDKNENSFPEYGNQISKMHISLFCLLTVDNFWKVAEILNTETLSYGDIKGFDVTAMA